jgi:hypothetical protein
MQTAPEYWEEQATELSRTQLSTVRDAAKAWSATTTALLGVFGTVAIVQGPTSVEKLTEDIRKWVVTAIVAAAILVVCSVLATARASRGPTKRYRPLTGLILAKWSKDETGKARWWLLVGQVTAVLAACLVLATGVAVLVSAASGTKGSAGSSVVVRTEQGAVKCGALAQKGGRLVLQDADGDEMLALDTGVADVTSVTSCPPD